MKGYFRRRGCTCGKKKCTCGAKWSFTIDIGQDPATGKRKQKTASGFDTKALAEEAATKLHYQLMHGTYIEEKNVSFNDFAEKWIEMYAATGKVKGSTVDIRRVKLKRMKEYFAQIKIKNITKTMYQDMLNDLSKKGAARKTIASIHEVGSLLFKKAVELEVISTNPTKFAEIPKEQKTVEQLEQELDIPPFLEKEELAMFLRTAKEQGLDQDYPVFLLMAYTGIRVGELCVLKWRDINFDEQTININKTLYNKATEDLSYQVTPPKSKKSKRIIDVDEMVLNVLEEHRSQQNVVRMKHRKTYHDEGFIFTHHSKLGYPKIQKDVGKRMTRLLKLAELNPNLTPHSLRHTHTSLLAEGGVSLETIVERLGHEDDKVTRRVYLHVTKPQKREASKKFAELMKGF